MQVPARRRSDLSRFVLLAHIPYPFCFDPFVHAGKIPAPTSTDDESEDSPGSVDRSDSEHDTWEKERLQRLRHQTNLDRDGAIQAFTESAR